MQHSGMALADQNRTSVAENALQEKTRQHRTRMHKARRTGQLKRTRVLGVHRNRFEFMIGLIISSALTGSFPARTVGQLSTASFGDPSSSDNYHRLQVNGLLMSTWDSQVSVDSPVPRFSWTPNHMGRGQSQTAYRIVVNNGTGDVWDSGVVQSGQSQLVEYGGQPLQSDTTYSVSVQWADSQGQTADWSDSYYFDTALLDSAEWAAYGSQYIGAPTSPDNATTLFRTEFSLPSGVSVTRARAYVVGLGFHELHVNGQRIGQDSLAPGWTQYTVRVLAMSYDVTAALVAGGANAVGVALGMGWRDTSKYPNVNGNTPASDDQPQVLRLVLLVHLSDGSQVAVASDGSWRCSAGPLLSSSIYDGTAYDSRLEQDGWDKPDFSGNWGSAAALTGPAGAIRFQPIPGIRVGAVIAPVALTQPSPGVWVFDFGQNAAGVCRLTLPACAAGTAVQLRHAEILDHSGDGNIYVGNLRSAKATDLYVCSGQAVDWTPPFTYHGFRFVELTGWPGTVSLSFLTAQHFYTSNAARGSLSFESAQQALGGHSLLDRVAGAIRWGQESNMMSVPTDCDQRDERLGWMGDAALSSEGFATGWDVQAFFTHFLALVRDEQDAEGTLPDVVPYMRYGGRPADPAWSAAYPQLLYTLWRLYGDAATVREHYPALRAYLDYVTGRVKASGLADMYSSYGDWVPPPPAPKCSNALLSSFSFIYNLRQAAQLAAALGLSGDAQQLTAQAVDLTEQYNAAFWRSDTRYYDNGVQTAQLLSLQLGAQAGSAAGLAALLTYTLNDVVATHGTHFTTGISGFKALWTMLPRLGRLDLALALALTCDYPSLVYMAVNPLEPATAVWELMDAPFEGDGMNSRNHHMFSSLGAVLYESFLGISQPDPLATLFVGGGAPDGSFPTAYSQITLQPPAVLGLAAASGQLTTAAGLVALAWARQGGWQCGKVAETQTLALTCGPRGGLITAVLFASFGTPLGACGEYGVDSACHANRSAATLSALCLGQPACTVQATNAVFGGDPCPNTAKWLVAQVACAAPASLSADLSVPVGSTATLLLPPLTLGALSLTEGPAAAPSPVWRNGSYVAGTDGVTGASWVAGRATSSVSSVAAALSVSLGSGDYSFLLIGSEGAHVCQAGPENEQLSFACPAGTAVTAVAFASFGTPASTACAASGGAAPYQIGACHAGTSRAAVEAACLGQPACTVMLSDVVFGDPCVGTLKAGLIDLVCAAP